MNNAVILIVDEEAIRTLLRTYLVTESYVVHRATNSWEALQLAHTTSPDLVLDLMLPGLDGVCRRIQAERNCSVMMLTARDDELDKLVGLSVGADITLPNRSARARRHVLGCSWDVCCWLPQLPVLHAWQPASLGLSCSWWREPFR